MPHRKRRTSMAGTGCFLQGLGVLSLGAAIATISTIVGPIVFGVLGIWLLFFGSSKSQWYECSDCGTRLAGASVTICPNCKGRFT